MADRSPLTGYEQLVNKLRGSVVQGTITVCAFTKGFKKSFAGESVFRAPELFMGKV